MKKSFIATAVAAGLLASGAAHAEPQVYGILHFAIDTYADDHLDGPGGTSAGVVETSELKLNSKTSAIGIKGSEDLGNGLKAIYKAEFKVNPFIKNDGESQSLERRDVWAGLKGGWGKLTFGTMSSNYKQMGGKVDPLYRTEAEGRGRLNMQSGLHGGSGINGGRMENTVNYTSPKMGGFSIVLNTTLAGAGANNSNADESIGAGIRWSNKAFLVYADYFDPSANGVTGNDESVAKIGGKWSGKAFQVSAQYEATEDQTGGDYIFANGLWNINKNNAVTLSVGQQDKVSQAFAVAYVHTMSKQTNVYAGYGSVEEDSAGSYASGLGYKADGTLHSDGSVFTFGLRKSF